MCIYIYTHIHSIACVYIIYIYILQYLGEACPFIRKSGWNGHSLNIPFGDVYCWKSTKEVHRLKKRFRRRHPSARWRWWSTGGCPRSGSWLWGPRRARSASARSESAPANRGPPYDLGGGLGRRGGGGAGEHTLKTGGWEFWFLFQLT